MKFNNERVLLRVDFNVPISKGVINDDTRIRAALPTIKMVLDEGGSLVIMSHLGRPLKKKNDDGSINVEKFSLRPVATYLKDKFNLNVSFCEETIGEKATAAANALKAGEILVVENTRFHEGEGKGDETFAKELSKLGTFYMNDAFGTAHRAHASTAIVAQYFDKDKKSFGLLMNSEIENATKLLNAPEKPFTAILGGAKVSDKIQLIEKLLDSCDHILIGGGMSYTFAKAQGGNIGNSICEDELMPMTLDVLEKAKAKGVTIHLPEDSVIADDFSPTANIKTVDKGNIPAGWEGLDIGPKTIEKFSKVIKESKTISWNGPQGVFEFEAFAKGTNAIAQAVADATQQNGAYSLIGGGDSVSAINKSGLADQVSFISTGGGAMLTFLEGKTLPGVKAIVG